MTRTLADQLGPEITTIRSDVKVTRQTRRGVPAYVLRDPVSLRHWQLDTDEYQVYSELRSRSPLSTVFARLVQSGVLQSDEEEEFYLYVVQLAEQNLLELPEHLATRVNAQRRRSRRSWSPFSLLSVRVPLLNPDRLLTAWAPLFRPLFTRAAAVVWGLLVAVAVLLIAAQTDAFLSAAHSCLSRPSALHLALVLLALKVLHESGHAMACKAFGGSVPEMGALFLVGTPCAYVDASACWSFRRKRQRWIVAAAGMFLETWIAALAVIGWSIVDDGAVRTTLASVILLSGVVTIGFNANPLMRFDGYYILSDVLEIPNLRHEARQVLLQFVHRYLLRVPASLNSNGYGPRVRLGLAGFGLCVIVYQGVVLAGIAWLLATRLGGLGVLLGTGLLAMILVRVAATTVRHLLRAPELESVRGRCVALGLATVTAVLVGATLIPIVPDVRATGIVCYASEHAVRTRVSGILESMSVQAGDVVAPGDVVASLINESLQRSWALSERRLLHSTSELRRIASTDAPNARPYKDRVNHSAATRDIALQEVLDLQVRAERGGYVLRAIDSFRTGQHVAEGEEVAVIGDGHLLIQCLLSAEQLSRVDVNKGNRIQFRASAYPRQSLWALVERTEARLTDERLREFGFVPTPEQPGHEMVLVVAHLDAGQGLPYLHGMTGTVAIGSKARTAGQIWLRAAMQLRNRLLVH